MVQILKLKIMMVIHRFLKGYKEIVKLLLKNDANIDSKNNNGKSALDLAVENGNSEIRIFLENIIKNTKPSVPLHELQKYEIVRAKMNSEETEQKNINWRPLSLIFHGGEPLKIGKEKFSAFCKILF